MLVAYGQTLVNHEEFEDVTIFWYRKNWETWRVLMSMQTLSHQFSRLSNEGPEELWDTF